LLIGTLHDPTIDPAGSPGFDASTAAAVTLINEEMGGINGRPIQLVPCAATPGNGLKCANKLIESKVELVIIGRTADEQLSRFRSANIPVIGTIPADPADLVAPDTYFFTGGRQSELASITAYVGKKYLGATAVGVIAPTPSAGDTSIDNFVSLLIAGGVFAYKSLGDRAPTEADFETLLRKAGPDTTGPVPPNPLLIPQVHVVLYEGASCLNAIRAHKALRLTGQVVALASCGDQAIIDAAGDDAAGWSFVGGVTIAAAEGAVMRSSIARSSGVSESGLNLSDEAVLAYEELMTLASVGRAISAKPGSAPVTGRAIADVIARDKGRLWGGAAYACGASVSQPAACVFGNQVRTYEAGGGLTPVGDGNLIEGQIPG
jgi:hypothetical protein